jgi:nucleoid DNA-binding protein
VNTGVIIRKLLEEGKRVILPGFGNLEVRESGNGVPASGKRIDPPGRTVKFDSTYSKDDGLLAAAIADQGEEEVEECTQQVLELVDAIKFTMDRGEEYLLANAGTFTRDDDGKVHFHHDPEWVLEPEQYGLDPMDLLELDDQPGELESTEAVGAPPAGPVPPAAGSGAPEKPTAAPVYEPWKEQKPKRRMSHWRVIWIVTGALILILVALILIPSERFRPGGRIPAGTEENSPSPQAGEASTEETSPEQTEPVQGTPEQTVPERTMPEQTEADLTGAAEQAEHNFFIIAGSFSHLGNASDLQDRLKARGYPSELMITENHMYRVVVQSYADKAEAEQALGLIQAEEGLGSCWLLSRK